MNENPRMFAAILNRNVILSRLMTALGQMTAVLVNQCDAMTLSSWKDADGELHTFLPHRFVILRAANSSQISRLRQKAIASEVAFADSWDMIDGRSGEFQVADVNAQELVYIGLVICAKADKLSALIGEFPEYTVPDMTGPLPGTLGENPNFDFFRRLGR